MAQAQVTEYPWNGVLLEGGLPNIGTPSSSLNVFSFMEQRNTKRVRVYLDPRVIMPVGSTTISSPVQAQLVAVADAARVTVAGQPPLTSEIEWALLGCTEPTSTTASRRPRVGWLENFWEKVDDVVGAHAATWGYAILSFPTVQDLATANSDPDGSMTAYGTLSWSPTEAAYLHTAPWLEIITREVTTHLRAAGATKKIIVPTAYGNDSARQVGSNHPSGPWINDSGVWYESVFTPLGSDGFQATTGYNVYRGQAALLDETFRSTWYESMYISQSAGQATVIDALDLFPPTPIAIPDEDADAVGPLPVTDLTATPLYSGTEVTWTAPTDFGDGDFVTYQVVVTDGVDSVEFRTTSTTILAGPFTNGTLYTVIVTVMTSLSDSTPVETTVTPSTSAFRTPEPWADPYVTPSEGPPPVVVPQPLTFAFPTLRNFRPDNYLKTQAEVPEGF